MEVSDSELENEMHYALKFCYHFSKTASEEVKLMKEAYKDKFLVGQCFLDVKVI